MALEVPLAMPATGRSSCAPSPVEIAASEARVTGCRFCGGTLHGFVDLGMSPLCESFLAADQLDAMEPFYPLKVMVCGDCFLAQLREYVSPEHIFRDYAYFSAYSDAWLDHARRYAEMAAQRFALGRDSRIIELASNDGYLLQFFVGKGFEVLGIDPAENVAKAAEKRGVRTLTRFFDLDTARELAATGITADLVAANNVLAQVPDINRFLAGLPLILRPNGVATFEFPHLLRLLEENQFDTIYHEHFSYFSLMTAERLFAAHGLRIFDVEELWTHGGSLRLYLCHEQAARPTTPAVARLIAREREAGLGDLATYAAFEQRVRATKHRLLEFLIDAKRSGQVDRRLRRAGQGQHAAELLRHPQRFSRLHRRSQSAQARQVPAGNAHPGAAARADRRDQARLPADPALEFEGRDHAADGVHPRMGRPLRRADPRGPGLSMSETSTSNMVKRCA